LPLKKVNPNNAVKIIRDISIIKGKKLRKRTNTISIESK